jgi:hypothetical protein
MIDHPDFDNPNIRMLAKRIKGIDKVLLVTFHATFLPSSIEEFGEDTFKFSVMVEKQPGDPNIFPAREFSRLVTKNLWNNPEHTNQQGENGAVVTGHDSVFNWFNNTINYYLQNPSANLSEISARTNS